MQHDDRAFARDLEAALARGRTLSWLGDDAFSGRLEALRARAEMPAAEGDHDRAAGRLQLLISGCLEKVPEVDDRLGRFARFIERAVATWIVESQHAEADPAETAVALAMWIAGDGGEALDRYRMWGAEALDEDGVGALEMTLDLVREGLAEGSPERRRTVEALKSILARSDDADSYAALCERETDLAPRDAELLARSCRRLGRLDEALAWADRGLGRVAERSWGDRAAWDLGRLRRTILCELDRIDEARTEAWAAYLERPSTTRLDEVLSLLPESQRHPGRERALDTLRNAPAGRAVQVLLATGEDERLAWQVADTTLKDLGEVNQMMARAAAEMLRPAHPLLAAKLYEAVAFRLLRSGRKTYYRRILADLREARGLLLGRSEMREWDRLVRKVRAAIRGKSVLEPRFESLVRGT